MAVNGQHRIVEWEDRFSVGVAEIDQQHRQLMLLLNQLNRALKTGGGHESALNSVRELAAYAMQHFQTEEGYMQRVEYPEYAEHKAEHESFCRQVVKFNDELTQRKVLLGVEILFYLRDWVVNHITQVDLRMKPYLAPAPDDAAPQNSELG